MNATTRPDGGTTPESYFAASTRAGVPGQDLPGGDPAPKYTPTTPYTLDAVCELSEDYFLVQNHDIDPAKDTVIAYSRADGQVGAMVLQDGKVLQVYRDATQAGGWAVLALPGADGVIDMVAGISSPGYGSAKGAVLKVFYVKSANPAQLNVAVETKPPAPGTPATFTTHDPVPWLDTTFNYNNAYFTDDHTQGRLQIALNFDSGLLVTAIKASAEDDSGNDAKLCFWTDTMTVEAIHPDQPIPVSHGVLDGFHYYPIISGFRAAAMVADDWTTSTPYIYLYVPDAVSKREMTVWGWELHSNRTSGTMRNTNNFLNPTTLPEDNTYVIGVENLSVVGAALMPTALIWTKRYMSPADTRLWACTFDTGRKTWHWIEMPVPDSVRAREDVPTVSTALTPRSQANPDHLYAQSLLDVFLVIDGTLHVFRQVESTSAEADGILPAYTPIIPLQPGVEMMTSQPCISTGDQLMIVSVSPNSPGTLQTLEKDPLTGWTGHPVHLEHTQEMQQDSAYRVQLTLSDAWNAGLAGAELSITASSQAVARVEGKTAGNPQTAVLGPTPVKLTADGGGEVSLALLADGLSAPTLTITADKLSAPVTVYPSGAVNTYLSGDTKQQLNYLDPLDEQTLTDAKTPQTDGQPAVLVAPEASKPGYAASAIANMTGAATEAQNKAKQGVVAATLGRTDGGRLAYLGQRHVGVGSGTGVSVQSGQTDINNWTHDVLHAIKKGAVKVSTVTRDLEHDVYKLATDLADWTEDEVEVTVDSIEKAAHVIHAEFNRLGGEIVHAVKWLEAEVIGVFHSAKDLSDRFETWIADFGGFAATMADSSKTTAENWLTGKKDDVTNELTTLTGRFPDDANMSNMADKPPDRVGTWRPPLPGRARQPATAPLRDPGDDDQKQPAHGDWFYRKIKHELAGSGLKINLSTMPDLKDKVTAFGEQALAHSGGFQNKFIDDLWKQVIVHYVQHPNDVNQMPLKPLLDGVIAVIDDAFDLAGKVVAAAFDLLSEIVRSISKMLSDTTLRDLPILGGLMKLIGLGDVSIGRVANLIFAFPTAVVYKIAHGADAQPFATNSLGSRHRQAIGDEAGDLQICAASVMGTWAVFDTASAAFVAADDDGGILFAGVDIAAPLIVTILTTPASKDGEPFFAPPVSGNASDVMGFVAWIFGAIPALCAALPLVYEKTIADDAQKRESYTQVTLWIETLTGVVALIFGMIANSDKAQPKGADYAGAVLNNMSTIAGAGLTNALSEPSGGISVVVTMALTLICGEIGATLYGIDG